MEPGTCNVFSPAYVDLGAGAGSLNWYDDGVGKLLYFFRLLYRPDGAFAGKYFEISVNTGRSTTYVCQKSSLH